MGKRKVSKKLAGVDNADYDDTASTTSTGTMLSSLALGGGSSDDDFLDDDPFQRALDDLFEKRADTREKAYRCLVGLMRAGVRIEDCMKSESTIFSRCKNSLKKGSAAEAALAATCLGLHIVTLGPDAESGASEVQTDLEKMAANGKSPDGKAAAMEALALLCFVAVSDELDVARVLTGLQSLWKQDSPKVRIAALRSWSLLFTSIPQPLTSSDAVDAVLARLSVLLTDNSIDVRKAAGEALALVCIEYNVSGDMEDEEDGEGGDAMSQESSGAGGMDDVMCRMKDLAKNTGEAQRRSKKERAAQRGAFRQLCGVMENGRVKEQKIRLQHGDSLVIDTLDSSVQINFLRSFLAGGFQAHLQHNVLLHQVFGYDPAQERPDRMSAVEKRMARGPGSKARAQERSSQRSHKETRTGW